MDYIEDTVLLHQEHAGLGDVFLTRLTFGAFRRAYPGRRLLLALPRRHFDAVSCHPDLDEIAAIESVVPEMYSMRHDLSVLYGFVEPTWNNCLRPWAHPAQMIAWRSGLGDLIDPDPKMRLSDAEKAEGHRLLGDHDVVLCPISSTAARDLTPEQVTGTMAGLRERGFDPVLLHKEPTYGRETLEGLSIRQVLGVLAAAEYVISVETSHHHAAGCLGTPTLALYSFCDGILYSSFYPRCEVVQKHEGLNLLPNQGALPVSDILSGFDKLREKHGKSGR